MSLSMLDPSLKSGLSPAIAGIGRAFTDQEHSFEQRRFRRHGLRPLVADCLLLATLTADAEHEGAPVQVLKLYETSSSELILEIMIGRPGLENAFHDCLASEDGAEFLDWIAGFDMAEILPCELRLDAGAADLHQSASQMKRTLEAMREQLQQLLSHYFPQTGRLAA